MVHPLIRDLDEVFNNCEYNSIDLNGLIETLTRSEGSVYWKLVIVTEGTGNHSLIVSSDTSELTLETSNLKLIEDLLSEGILLC
jgi:hypothetical protein